MRHEAILDATEDDGTSYRSHLELKARKGDHWAVNQLLGPDEPETLYYLVEWVYGLCGRSGASMSGIAPLSYGTISDWSRLMGTSPTDLEVQALILLDGVIRNPDQAKEPDDVTEPEPWPEQING